MKIGIDSLAVAVPKIHLPIKTLAENRNIEPDKLIKGLGLQKMTFPDVHQDVITFAANAVYNLFQQATINPESIGRIYVGSESGIDASKPIASYVLQLIEEQLEPKFGKHALRHCDVLDITFACIGGVDALQNTVDWIRLDPKRQGIVVATDFAKYDLESTGEYTQGAGAIAMHIKQDPDMISFSEATGVSTRGVFDFFKPKRYLSKAAVTGKQDNPEWFGILENEIALHQEQPVFDGQYSNTCYIDRIIEAYTHYKKITGQENVVLYQNWSSIVMHLPYAYQGRRTFTEIYARENPEIQLLPTAPDYKEQIKTIAKSAAYLDFVQQTIAPSEWASSVVGNMYTGSLFLGLAATLAYQAQNNIEATGNTIGFIAYGSGSKSKVFEGTIEAKWKDAVVRTALYNILEESTPISMERYTALHKKELKESILPPKDEFVLDYIETESPVLRGARYYNFIH
ncbi:hydroxymethylglutaryl-CoA synthase family protein [Flavobacterium kingsejongi]|uniref:Hydroxymethylglutaryl-CoA synthase n=1 Tax=Flavobacterium kingsejongi TaxID=1678728 RepID=A0A2S1LR39_9FLAO|nr:hydroxymethylglutaryl-CoA synthase [Flavobacterium kingsejongi]APZ88323.1 HMG-CoA synthase [Flavobacterium sp.]AWG26225.1 hydroxymethylglutaryl-CoA synthase [Flavobacterium kingsejongi]